MGHTNMPSQSPASPFGGSQQSDAYPSSSFAPPQSPDGSITGPSSPYSLPADTPPPAYMPPDNDKQENAMDISKPTPTPQHIGSPPNFRHGKNVLN